MLSMLEETNHENLRRYERICLQGMEREMLHFYSERLGAVEINNTFYRMPRESVLKSWAEQVSGGFIFALKAPQVITHIKQLRNVFEETEYLFKTLSVLGG